MSAGRSVLLCNQDIYSHNHSLPTYLNVKTYIHIKRIKVQHILKVNFKYLIGIASFRLCIRVYIY